LVVGLDVTVVEEERSEYAVETRVALLVLEFVKIVVHGIGYLELLRHVYPCFPTLKVLLLVGCESLQRILLISRCVGRYG
jgi:hypothetical protein